MMEIRQPWLKRGRNSVTAITVQLEDDMAEVLRRLAAEQQRSETDIVREALAAYVHSARPLPKGMGKYHSGQGDVSEKARDLLRQAVKEGQ
jgi:hypothetical protein